MYLCICVFKKLDNVKCLKKKKIHLQKDDVRKTTMSNVQSPKLPSSLMNRARRVEERRKEIGRRGRKFDGDTLLFKYLKYK